MERLSEAMKELLMILEKDGRATAEQLAVMTGRPLAEVGQALRALEDEKILLGARSVINWEKAEGQLVSAIIELKVTPKQKGFDEVARVISRFPQVRSVYLMSGAYDLGLIVEDKGMKEIALFVAEQLAPMEAVLSTGTHFMLKTYKDAGIMFDTGDTDNRQVITL